MNKEWFTISELRAARVSTFSEAVFAELVEDYPKLTSLHARIRRYSFSRDMPETARTDGLSQLEFHISLFGRSEQLALARADQVEAIEARILKLGIHQEVASP